MLQTAKAVTDALYARGVRRIWQCSQYARIWKPGISQVGSTGSLTPHINTWCAHIIRDVYGRNPIIILGQHFNLLHGQLFSVSVNIRTLVS